MTSKTAPVSVRLPPDLKTALEHAAKADVRSLSSLIEKILTDWVVAQGETKARRTR